MTRPHGDAGSAAVLVTVLAGVMLVTALVGAAVGGLVVGQRRAAVAADLAALAGADLLAGPGRVGVAAAAACARAAETAAANGAELTECRTVGSDLTVTTTVHVAGPWGTAWTVSAAARAGPATSVAGPGR